METRNPVGWFEIYVSDMARARAFYEAVLQTRFTPLSVEGADYEMLMFDGEPDRAGATGALMRHPMRKPSAEGTLIYFSCLDCAVEAQRAAENGGTIHLPKQSIAPYGFMAIVGDSEGNAIGLHSMS